MVKFLKDSYNGIYLVLLKPYMPKGKTLAVLAGGILLGLFWAYVLSPAIYYDADPRSLHQSWQDEWVKLLADRYALEPDPNIAANVTLLLQSVDDPLGIVTRLIATPGEEANQAKLQAIQPYAAQAQPNAVQAPQPSLLGNIAVFIVAPVILLVLSIIFAIVWGMFIEPNLVEPLRKRMRGETTSPEVAQERKARVETQRLMETKKTDFTATTSYGPPLMQRMSTYTPGFGTYDESYTIEDEQERFLGECGALISETIGTGDPAKATAVEVWLFDKDDFVRTVTKVFASEYAFNDPAMRSKLEAKGDLVQAQPGAVVTMETNTLRLQARIVDMQYGTGPLPPNSYFEKMTIELAAWRKDATGAAVAAPVAQQPVMTAQALPTQTLNIQPPTPRQQPAPYQAPAPTYQPPAQSPAQPAPYQAPAPIPPMSAPATQSPAPPPIRPASSPPARPAPAPNPSSDDDPFGGTGDFTPIT